MVDPELLKRSMARSPRYGIIREKNPRTLGSVVVVVIVVVAVVAVGVVVVFCCETQHFRRQATEAFFCRGTCRAQQQSRLERVVFFFLFPIIRFVRIVRRWLYCSGA